MLKSGTNFLNTIYEVTINICPGHEVIKLEIFMLNSTEYEISTSHKN